MIDNRFLAKTQNEQTIIEHTEDLLRLLEKFKIEFPKNLDHEIIELIYLSALYHDIGKLNRRFQNKLYEKLGYTKIDIHEKTWEEIPHGYLSPAFINYKKLEETVGKENAEIIIAAIFHHHSRENLDSEKRKQLKEMFKKELKDDLSEFRYKKAELLTDDLNSKYLKKIRFLGNKKAHHEQIMKYVLVKGFLNKLDYAASSQIKEAAIEKKIMNPEDQIGPLTKEKMLRKYSLRPLQKYLLEHTDSNHLVIASTGMGKTEAALLWIDREKGYFTLPLKISINAIYNRIKFDYGYPDVELIHSSMTDVYLLEDSQRKINIQERKQLAKLHSHPLIVTTIDQIFKFVFLAKGFEFILATLSYSKVVIDEIQMYDPQLLACLIRGIKLIQDYGGNFLIMTATFPKYLLDVMNDAGIDLKKCLQSQFLIEDSQCSHRHKIKIIGRELPLNTLKKYYGKKKILIIANTVKRSQEYYELLINEGMKVHLLHSRFLRRDRNLLEDAIFNIGQPESTQNDVWITTQIVEASLDIDFDLLVTEMCSIDSLSQRIGRVYRKRYHYANEEPNILVIANRNTARGKVIDDAIYNASLKAVEKFDGCFITESDKQIMIDMVFDETLNPEITTYKNRVKSMIDELENLELFQRTKKDIDEKFRNIDSYSGIPAKVINKLEYDGTLKKISEGLCSDDYNKRLISRNELLSYSVSVRDYRVCRESSEEFMKKYNLFIIDMDYEFETSDLTGKGLFMCNPDDEEVFI